MNPPDFGINKLANYLEQVDKVIASVSPKYVNGVQRLLSSSGKRWRPSMVISIAHFSGKAVDKRVINAAAAVELVHIASLVHDDIIDQAEFRRGAATINSREGLESSIIAGDYLFAKGCSLASSVSSELGELMAETIATLCEGEALELKDRLNKDRTKESLINAIRGKTSSLFIAACQIGGLVSGLSKQDIKALTEYADNLGIAYQLIDDVNDFTLPKSISGKTAGGDIAEGNYTLPVILSLGGPNGKLLRDILTPDALITPEIIRLLTSDRSLQLSVQEADKYKHRSEEALNKLSKNELRVCLRKYLEII